jgi:hypothetical protein
MRLFTIPLLAAALVVVPPNPATAAQTVRVTSLSALQSALDKANPGDTIALADGSYSAGSTLAIKRSGSGSAPVTVTAEHVGKATITGSKGFSFASGVSNVVLRGFKFRNGASLSVPAGASRNRLSRNDFQLTSGGNWVTVSGDDTEVDHNVFQNRTSQGVFLQILGPSRSGSASAITSRTRRTRFSTTTCSRRPTAASSRATCSSARASGSTATTTGS